jgi:uncharacterized membrane-anchored protein YhcB (DUF1043 family)
VTNIKSLIKDYREERKQNTASLRTTNSKDFDKIYAKENSNPYLEKPMKQTAQREERKPKHKDQDRGMHSSEERRDYSSGGSGSKYVDSTKKRAFKESPIRHVYKK